jgi:dTDP-4-dehydrorhamnose 3,5-epimerase
MRGVHFADIPPGQAKQIICVSGAILDVVVDLRVGSPNFGRHVTVRLDDQNRRTLYISEGLGHAFVALTEATTVYLCSDSYRPEREHGVHPLDPDLAIAWPAGIEPIMSPRDAAAPSLAQALESGMLPDYQECLDHYAKLSQ